MRVSGEEVIASEKIAKIEPYNRALGEKSSYGFFLYAHELSFRSMTRVDLDEVMAIERSSFTYPWSARFFLQEIAAQCARPIVAEINGRIVGYILFWILPDAVDIHNIAVHPDYRRQGIGRQLLDQAITSARTRASLRVTLEVRKSNLSAQKLYESQGFAVTGMRKGYYSDDGEDAIAMALELKV
jgi:ribosomal-protein-alanine N-acetyltransferase